MVLTDYFKKQRNITWDFAKQCGVNNGVIRLPEDKGFDYSDYSHWEKIYKNFTDFGIKPLVIEPMPNELHDHIKVGDGKRDRAIEQVIKMLAMMDKFDVFYTIGCAVYERAKVGKNCYYRLGTGSKAAP